MLQNLYHCDDISRQVYTIVENNKQRNVLTSNLNYNTDKPKFTLKVRA